MIIWHFIKMKNQFSDKTSHSGIIYNTSISTLKNEIILFLKTQAGNRERILLKPEGAVIITKKETGP